MCSLSSCVINSLSHLSFTSFSLFIQILVFNTQSSYLTLLISSFKFIYLLFVSHLLKDALIPPALNIPLSLASLDFILMQYNF